MKKFEEFEKAHQDAMRDIKEYSTKSQSEMMAITNYLLKTEDNPYSFLPKGWEGSIATSTDFLSLLNVIHHALFDDGDISFPIVNGEPRIALVSRHTENYLDFILTDNEIKDLKSGKKQYTVKQCKDVLDFIEKHQEYFKNQVKNWFTNDAAREGLDFALEYYQKYSNFDQKWQFDQNIIQKIQSIRKIFRIVKNDGLDLNEEENKSIAPKLK